MRILIQNVNIVTVDENMSIIYNGCIGIEENLISFVADDKESELLTNFKADKIIYGNGRFIMPGLVNAHTHSPMTILRGIADDLPFDEWLFQRIVPIEDQLTAEDVYWGAVLGMAEMIRCGVTCFADMYFYADIIVNAIEKVGMRANICGVPMKRAQNSFGAEIAEYRSYLKKWRNNQNGLIKGYVCIHSIYTHDEETIRSYIGLAKELETGIHIHVSETLQETQYMQEKYKKSTVKMLDEWGAFDVNTIAAHCVHLEEEDLNILREKKVNPVHNPSSNLKLANGIADISKMMDYEINACLGTDGAASNNNLNIIEEMHIAALLQKGLKRDPTALKAEQVIRMATVNGGKALGFGPDIGCIKKGAKADLIIINTDQLHLTPMNNIHTAIVYSLQGSDIDTVIINGDIIMEDKELKTIDEEKLKFKIRKMVQRFIS